MPVGQLAAGVEILVQQDRDLAGERTERRVVGGTDPAVRPLSNVPPLRRRSRSHRASRDAAAASAGFRLSAYTLLQHPEQWPQLGAEPARVGPAVEELLRYLTIVQFGLGRVTTEDLELGNEQVRAGGTRPSRS